MQIQNIQDLNIKIAKQVFGYTVTTGNNGQLQILKNFENQVVAIRLPPYSEDVAYAMDVVEHLKDQIHFGFKKGPPNQITLTFLKAKIEPFIISFESEISFAVAVCTAALAGLELLNQAASACSGNQMF